MKLKKLSSLFDSLSTEPMSGQAKESVAHNDISKTDFNSGVPQFVIAIGV